MWPALTASLVPNWLLVFSALMDPSGSTNASPPASGQPSRNRYLVGGSFLGVAGGGYGASVICLSPLTQKALFFLSALLGLLSNLARTEVVHLDHSTGIPLPNLDITVPPQNRDTVAGNHLALPSLTPVMQPKDPAGGVGQKFL